MHASYLAYMELIGSVFYDTDTNGVCYSHWDKWIDLTHVRAQFKVIFVNDTPV